MSKQPDPVLHHFRPSWAICAFDGSSLSDRTPMRAKRPVVDVRSAPSDDAALDTQLLFGEAVMVYGMEDGWAWVQSNWDHYQGYCRLEFLEPANLVEPTYRVMAARTFAYDKPDLKASMIATLPMGAEVCVEEWIDTSNGLYARLSNGMGVFAKHLAPLDQFATDPVDVALELLKTPYLWAGRSGLGLDCSARVQQALRLCGIAAYRDTDMQEATLGECLAADMPLHDLKRGDFVFWKGHVGIVEGPNSLIHANAYSMDVTVEPLDGAVERISGLYAQPTSFRRLKS